MRDLIEPLGVAAARVDLHGQTERRDQWDLAGLEMVRMEVALDVARQRVLRPSPVCQRGGEELELAARRREAAHDPVVHQNAHRTSSFRVAVRRWLRYDVQRDRTRCLGEDATVAIRLRVLQL